MRLGQHGTDGAGGDACVNEVVDDQPALALVLLGGSTFQQFDLGAALHAVVGRAAHRVDQAKIQFACHDGGGDQPATGDRDQPFERPQVGQPPGQRPGVAVQFRP